MKLLSLDRALRLTRFWILVTTLSLPGIIRAGNSNIPGPNSTVTLSWDRSADRSVKGYRLHYGVTSGRNYLHIRDVGKATFCKLSNLIPGMKYYFVVTSYNASGKESLPSNEVSFIAPKSTPTSHL
jgi:hypothetical protein